jgi:hypothetical protein
MTEAPSTASLWSRVTGDAFGLGPVMRLIADPQFQRDSMAMMRGLAEAGKRQARVEAKLDYLMGINGHAEAIVNINERIENDFAAAAERARSQAVAAGALPSPLASLGASSTSTAAAFPDGRPGAELGGDPATSAPADDASPLDRGAANGGGGGGRQARATDAGFLVNRGG